MRANGASVELRLSLRSVYFRLEGESKAKIGLNKVFQRRIEVMIPTPDEVIASLAKDCDIVSKAILEAATGLPEKAIVRYIRRCIVKPLIYP
jgi:hypothetical protein